MNELHTREHPGVTLPFSFCSCPSSLTCESLKMFFLRSDSIRFWATKAKGAQTGDKSKERGETATRSLVAPRFPWRRFPVPFPPISRTNQARGEGRGPRQFAILRAMYRYLFCAWACEKKKKKDERRVNPKKAQEHCSLGIPTMHNPVCHGCCQSRLFVPRFLRMLPMCVIGFCFKGCCFLALFFSNLNNLPLKALRSARPVPSPGPTAIPSTPPPARRRAGWQEQQQQDRQRQVQHTKPHL